MCWTDRWLIWFQASVFGREVLASSQCLPFWSCLFIQFQNVGLHGYKAINAIDDPMML
jgi:hypothetical protein